MQIRWTDVAVKSLNAVFDYTEDEFGKQQVAVIGEKIMSTVREIAALPTAFPKETLLSEKGDYRSAVVIRELKVVYRIAQPDTIFILFVWNTRMSPQKVIKQIKKRG